MKSPGDATVAPTVDSAAQAEQTLLAAVATADDAVGVLTAVRRDRVVTDFRVDYLNEAAGRRLGVPPARCQGKLLSTLATGGGCALSVADCVRAISTGSWSTTAVADIESGFPRASRPVYLESVPTHDQVVAVWPSARQGPPAARPAIARPALVRRIERLEQSNAELAQFAYVASHDLSEPLRTIAGFAELLAQRYAGQLDDQADEFLGYITASTTRLKKMIDSLLAYSRLDTRPQRYRDVDCDLLAAEVLDGLGDMIARTDGVVEVEPLPHVIADRTQLGEALQNLIANGLTYTVSGRPPHVVVRARDREYGWCFEVEDNGVGIDPADRQRIFTLFQRLRGGEQGAGSGIGLTITKKIVERHGGRIWVEEGATGGSRFCFTVEPEC